MTKEERKREQAQQVRARVLHELDKSAGVFAAKNINAPCVWLDQPGGGYIHAGVFAAKESFDQALIRELTVGHMPVRFSKKFVAEL